ncbi:MAG: DUF342 domain-containing protein [Okeania sp. SIO3B3]|nr:DUF342 domain-containing protein [Okeania sp. SIO3B3]
MAEQASSSNAATQAAAVDAVVDVNISDDGMFATLVDYQPAQNGGEPLTLERLQDLAKRAGLRMQIPPKVQIKIMDALEAGEDPSGTIVAQGTPPQPPQDGTIKFRGNPELPVFPGDCIGHAMPPTQGEHGQTVDGLPVEPPSVQVRELEPDSEGNVSISPQTGEIVARRHGIARVKNALVYIEPLIEPSEDKLIATAKVFASDTMGEVPTVGRYKDALQSEGIRGKPDLNALGAAVARAKAEGKPQENIEVVHANMPVDGKDGYFQPEFQTISSGAVDEAGNINFSERGAAQSVESGDELGHIVPPTFGTPGKNVLGEILACRDGAPCTMTLGEGVEFAADGKTIRATTEGVIINTGSTIAVSDLFEVKSDLDYSVGNIRLNKGSVAIAGNLLEGFSVLAPGNVWVNETVEGARVEAGGNVIVKGGLAMSDKGKLDVDGEVVARFALRAVVEAQGDVVISSSITDSKIFSGGRVICTREKGIISGGEIRCIKGLEAKELGSELGVVTKIIVGIDVKDDVELTEELQECKQQIDKIRGAIGNAKPDEILMRAPASKQQAIGALLHALEKYEERRRELQTEKDELQERALAESSKAQIVVHGAIHPGVTITMGGRTFTVKQRLPYAKIRYDQESGKVVAETASNKPEE